MPQGPRRARTVELLSCSLVLALCGAFASCKSAPPVTEAKPAPPAAPPVVKPFDGTAQACASHIAPVPGPDYPTYKYNCAMPALPPGYPMPRPMDQRPWQASGATGPLNVNDPANIDKLMAALKAYVAPVFNPYIGDPTNDAKRPDKAGWRMMPWLGDVDCDVGWDSGRDSSVGTSTGQPIPAGTLPGQRTEPGSGDLQNHSITWYDPWGAFALSSVFGAPTPGVGDPTREQMVDGTVIVKMGVLTPYADGTDWPTVQTAPMWPVYRPPVGVSTNYCQNSDPATFKLLQTKLIQFDIILKSSFFAPKSEWVFATWLFDPNAKGEQPLDRFTLLGVMWGNDPGIAQTDMCTPVSPLQENWINPGTPDYGYQQLGWGCRLSGPIDIARRSAVFSDGSTCATARVSACMSCHGSSEFATKAGASAATLYPLQKGYSPFLVADPGSAQWNNWFQSRSPTQPQGDQQGQNQGDYIAFDYDMVFITAVPVSQAAAGDDRLEAIAAHYTSHLNVSRKQAPMALVGPPAGAKTSPSAGCDCSCYPKKNAKKPAKADKK